MHKKHSNPQKVKALSSNFIFKNSSNFLLDYNRFMLADNKNIQGKFIKISFSPNQKSGLKIYIFRCFYKMMSDYGRSLN